MEERSFAEQSPEAQAKLCVQVTLVPTSPAGQMGSMLMRKLSLAYLVIFILLETNWYWMQPACLLLSCNFKKCISNKYMNCVFVCVFNRSEYLLSNRRKGLMLHLVSSEISPTPREPYRAVNWWSWCQPLISCLGSDWFARTSGSQLLKETRLSRPWTQTQSPGLPKLATQERLTPWIQPNETLLTLLSSRAVR